MSTPRESVIEGRAREYARAHGVMFLKFTSPGCRGVPDRLLIAPGGRVGFLEFKRAGGRLDPLQAHWQRKLEAQGAQCGVVHTLEAAKLFIDSLLVL